MNRPEDPDDDGVVQWSDEDDADVTDRLRDSLAREAERVEVNDRWSEISAAARATRRRRPLVALVAAGVALVVGAGLGGMFLQDRLTAGPAGPPPVTTSSSPSPTQPRTTSVPQPPTDPTVSASATASATQKSDPTPADPTQSETSGTPDGDEKAEPISGVAVYFVGDSKDSSWLYREFHTVPGAGDEVTAAVNAQLSTAPLDTDYRNPWQPADRSAEVTRDGDDLTVDLPAEAFGEDVDAETAELAVQQLVWTATAAAGTSGSVTITVDRKPYEAWGTVALGEPIGRDAEARAPIWITDPTEGQTDQAGTVTVLGSSTSFEGNVQWKITEADSDEVVEDGYSTGGSMGEFDDFEFSADLEPGRYTVTVYAEDQSDGESSEGPVMFADTKTWTVE